MVSVVLYSDQPILAKGLGAVIAADPALELIASCSKVAALKEHLANQAPHLAVLETTPDITLAALRELQSLAPGCKLILWTDSIAGDFALQALNLGVRGILRKTLPVEAHRLCLHRVYSGGLWFEKSLTDSVRDRCVLLTARESQLVSMLARGLKNKEIAGELGITEGTVKVYLHHLFQKSGAKDRLRLGLQGLKSLGMSDISPVDRGELRSLVIDPIMPAIESELALLESPAVLAQLLSAWPAYSPLAAASPGVPLKPAPLAEALLPREQPVRKRQYRDRVCSCGDCGRCKGNARWNRIFDEKFADPSYYGPKSFRHNSPLGGV
jgi:two-component system nitrate/nitrite response regulator NarL